MKDKQKLETSIVIPEKIQVDIDSGNIKIKGPKGEVSKKFLNPEVRIEVKENKIILTGVKNTKREKKLIGSFKAHLKNMIKGCERPYVYTLKICTGHFPMNVSLNKNEFIVKNLFGEKHPRTLIIREGVTVKIEGELINVEGIDKAVCGQVAADIESLTKRTSYDKRIFQDGIYIIKKDEKEIK